MKTIKALKGVFNETVKGLRIATDGPIDEEVLMIIAHGFSIQIKDKNLRAEFIDWLFITYTISL